MLWVSFSSSREDMRSLCQTRHLRCHDVISEIMSEKILRARGSLTGDLVDHHTDENEANLGVSWQVGSPVFPDERAGAPADLLR